MLMSDVFVNVLGHGPFSHMFDALFIPTARPDSGWKVSTTVLYLYTMLQMKELGYIILILFFLSIHQ